MKFVKPIAILLALTAPLAHSKDKKKDNLPAVFNTARYVYVQAEDGDIMRPGLFPEDREAIANVQDAVHHWNRYTVTLNRKDADLVIIVRKGRSAAAQLHGGIGVGSASEIGAGYPNRNPVGPGNTNPDRNSGADVGTQGEVGASDDTLRVFMLTPDGKLNGPLWSREMKEGLDAPGVMLLRALRDAVDRAYPPQPAGQPATPAKP